MIRVALKGLAQHRLRTVLTTLAIVVGVATMSAAFTLSDTLRKGSDALSSASYDGTAAVVSARTAFDRSSDGYTKAPTISESELAAVRRVPGVGVAVGDLTNTTTKMLQASGEPIGDGPYFGIGLDARTPGFERVTPLRLREGHWAAGPEEVVIDASTAEREGLGIGDRVRVAPGGPARYFRVVGVARFGSVKSIGTATAAVFDLRTAQRLFGSEGRLDSVLVAARRGASAADVRHALAAALPATAQVTTAAEHDRFTLDGLDGFVDVIGIVLVAFAAVAILVGAFTIFNTLSITVAQRSREFGLLRMVGAGRRQVLGAVLAEALALGLAASVVGVVAGLGLAKGLSTVLAGLGLDLPQTGTVFALRTVVVSLAVGTVVTVLAGLVPAWRATRIAPVAALRAASPDGHEPGRVGRLVRAVAGALGRPAQVVGGAAGSLARRNAMRNPGRVAVTALALTIGVALVTAVSVLGQGLKDSTTGSLQERLSATHVVVDKDGWTPIDGGVERRVASAPGVRAVSSVRQDGALAFGDEEGVNVVDPATVGRVLDFEWERGDRSVLAGLGTDGAVVDEGWATEHGLGVGDRFSLTSAAGRRLALRVRGIEASPVIDILGLGPITISRQAAAEAGMAERRNRFTLVDAPGADPRALGAALRANPEVEVQTAAQYIDEQAKSIDPLLAIFYVLLTLAVVVSLFGLVNALVLSTFERTRELGMLRAVGMTRRQLRRMVRHESIITAVLGAAIGMAAGLGLAGLAVALWGDVGLAFGVPVGALVAFTLVAIAAGVLAAVLPARRAARMDVLGALAYE
jgi:putative ABC transport system permease protein